MKLFNKIFFGAATVAVMGAFSSCKEEATLEGADAIYIDMAQTNLSLLAGDTVKLSARVTNASGKEINTPIKWSVDDESVVKIIDIVEYEEIPNPDYQPPVEDEEDPGSPGEDEGEGEGEGEGGETPETPASRADEGGETPAPDPVPGEEPEYLVTEHHFVGITAPKGSQGKQTFIRATLENGMYALTTVSVGRNSLADAVKWDGNVKTSYRGNSNPIDTVWFNVNPIAVVDDYEVSYDIELTETITTASNPEDADFAFYGDPIYIDRKNNRVGVVYSAPRMLGKAKCTLTIGNDGESASDVGEILICPEISAGFEYMKNGVLVRPGYGPETPSNPKPKQISEDMNVNSTKNIGVCLGILSGRPDDIRNAMLADSAGYFKWSVDGAGVLVDELFYDENYQSGFVSYIKLRSGIREGKARVTYSMPGQDFVCDVVVKDYSISYPVNDIIVEHDGVEYAENDLITCYIGTPFTLNIRTDPEASFAYNIPEVVSSDPSILAVRERGTEDGYTRFFDINGLGTVTLTMTSLDVTKTVRVEVKDRVSRTTWTETYLKELAKGNSADIGINLYMASSGSPVTSYDGVITWSSSDPSVLAVAADPSNPLKATVTGVADGTATVTCNVEGFGELTRDITVFTLSGITFDSSNTAEGYAFEDWMMMVTNSGEEYYFYYTPLDQYLGHYTGSDGSIEFSGNTLTDVTYDFTISDNGDGMFLVNGWFETPDGVRYTIDNMVCSNE